MAVLVGIPNAEYVAVGVVAIFLVVWYLIRHFKGGRLGLERRELQEDEQLKEMDRTIIVDIKQEHNDALELRDLFYKLNTRAYDLKFNVYEHDIKANFDYIVTGLDILSKGDKSVLNDRAKVQELFKSIDVYLNIFSDSKDEWIVAYIRQIRAAQRRLFKDIIGQDELLRRRFALLRKAERETIAEDGAYERAA